MSEAFSELVQAHQRKIVAICYRMLGNLDDARDSTQDAFLRLWHGTAFRQSAGTATLPILIKTAINICIDKLRRQKLLHFFMLDTNEASQATSGNSPFEQTNANEMNALIEKAMHRLKPKQKAV